MNKVLLCILWITVALMVSTGSVCAYEENTTSQISSTSDSEEAIQAIEDAASSGLRKIDEISKNISTNIKSDPVNSANKNQTELTSQNSNIYYKGIYSIVLKDISTNKFLSNKKVNFVINGVSYSSITDMNGISKLQLSFTPGQYRITANFEGDNDYLSSSLVENINILNTIQANDIVKYYKGSTQYSATFIKSDASPLTETNVAITVAGKTYTVKTNMDGVASINLNLNPGTYDVVAQDPLTGFRLTTSFKVLSTINANNIKKVYGDGRKFTAKFLKSDGKALSNAYVNFKLNGKTYKVKTNADGVAKLSITNLKKGTHKITSVNKDGLTQSNQIVVLKKVASKLTTQYFTFLKSEKKTIKVKLQNSLGYAPKAGKIIKFSVNSKSYTKKTNSAGVAKLKLTGLKTGVYTVKYSFGGTSCYKPTSTKNKVAIISTKNPTFTVKSSKIFPPNKNNNFKVKLTAGGVVLEKRSVNFKLNGISTSKNTNKDGIASIPINLALGKYKISYSVNKDKKINAKSSSCTIEVTQKSKTTLTWASSVAFTPGKKTLKVLLSKGDGKAISKHNVKLTLKGKTYTSKTSSSGYAKFNVNLALGKHKISVKYGGNDKFYASSLKKTVNVKKTITKGVNDINTISDLKAYLKASPNCQVSNAKISMLVKNIIKGMSSKNDKAKAIFNYVRDTLYYDYYYNTRYGALTTLDVRIANCVDHSHLLVAMFRTAGLHARYVHGNCKFTNGKTYGHVWAQVLIGDTWTVADATSSKNSLGKINNWNTKTFTIKSKCASIYF